MASTSALSALQPVKLGSSLPKMFFIEGPTLKPLSMHAATSLPHARCAGTEISHPIAPALVSAVPKAAVLADGALALSDRLATAERELGQLCSQLKTHAGPFAVQELYRLPHAALDRLRSLWLTVQRNRLALLGHADHLFDSAVESHSQRGKFVVADGDSLMFFDDEDAAVDAAAAVAVRLLGPLGCVAYARAGEPLPPPPHLEKADAMSATPAVTPTVPEACFAVALSDRLAIAERELGQLCSQLKTHAGPFTVQELYRLPHAALDRLRSLWLTVQRNRLALLGHADHLFDSAVESHSQRGKFVVADGDSLMFFDDEDAAVDAAAAVAVRLLGPLGCVAYARAGEPLPPPYAMQPGSAENADILQQMSQLHEVVGGHSVAYPGEDVLPCMDVLIFMFDAAGVARSVTSCPAVYATGAIDKVYVGNSAADLRTPSSFGGTFGRTVHCHPSSEAAAFSALRCSCGPVVTIASKATCPLWTKLVVGNAPRTYLDWKDHPVFVIGAPVVSKRWGLSVLGTADGRFRFVKLASEDLERGGASAADFCAASDGDGAGNAADL